MWWMVGGGGGGELLIRGSLAVAFRIEKEKRKKLN